MRPIAARTMAELRALTPPECWPRVPARDLRKRHLVEAVRIALKTRAYGAVVRAGLEGFAAVERSLERAR